MLTALACLASGYSLEILVPLPSNSCMEELLVAYQEGSLAAFDEFFKRTKDPLYSFVLLRVRNAEVAHDIIQEAYFRIHRYILNYKKGAGTAIPWILTIVRNCIQDYWQQQKKSQKLESEVKKIEHNVSASAEQAYFFKELILQLENHIAQDELELLTDRILSEFSFDEIADQRGIRADSARQKFFRILAKIKKTTLN